MKTRQMVLGLVLSAGVLTATPSAFGQVKTESPAVAANKQLAEANTALNAAKVLNETARLKAVSTFKTTNPDYAKAEDDLKKAKLDMEAAKIAAQAAARNKPEYKSAVTVKANAQEKLRALAGDPGPAYDAVMKDFTSSATLLNRLDSQALETDQKYIDAKTKYLEAQKAVEAYKTQIDEACKNDPEYLQVNQTFLAADLAVKAAQDNLKQIRKSESEARASEAKSRAASKTPPAPRN